MTVPPPNEHYTWPTAPAGARRPRTRESGQATLANSPGHTPTRRQGAFVGTVFAVAAVWATVFMGIELPGGLALLAVGVVVAAAATAIVWVRPFAQGFLLACLVAGPLAVVLLMVLLMALFATMGP